MYILKGGMYYHSFMNIDPCGVGSWVMNFIIIVLSYLFLQSFTIDIIEIEEKKKQLNFDFKKYGKFISLEIIRKTQFIALLGGCVAALSGAGNEQIIGSIWQKMKFPLQRVEHTAIFTVSFTSFISIL